MAFPLLLAALALGGADDETQQKPFVLQTYPIASLLDPQGHATAQLSLLPFKVGANAEIPQIEAEERRILGYDDLVTIVREVVAPGAWDEGASIDLNSSGELLVRAPTDVQQELADFLQKFSQAVLPRERLEVRVYGSIPEGAACVQEAASADARLAKAGDSGATLLRSVTLGLRDGAARRASTAERETFVEDWDVQIAQGAVIGAPIVCELVAGLELVVRSARVQQGTLLELVLREAEHAAPTEARRLFATGALKVQDNVVDRIAAGTIEQPRMGFVALAGTFLVPDGAALWIPTTVLTSTGPVSGLLDLRVRGDRAARSSIEGLRASTSEAERRRFEVVSTGLSGLGHVVVPAPAPDLFDHGWHARATDLQWWIAQLDGDCSGEEAANLLHGVIGADFDEGTASVSGFSGHLWTWMTRSAADRAQPAYDRILRVDPLLAVDGSVTSHDGERLASFRVPLLPGRELTLWNGLEGQSVSAWDVDVANEAQIPNVTTETYVDGFALRLVARASPTGGFELRVVGKLCFLDGPPKPTELHDQSHLVVDKLRTRTTVVDDSVLLPASGGSATFGGAPLALKLDVKPLAR